VLAPAANRTKAAISRAAGKVRIGFSSGRYEY